MTLCDDIIVGEKFIQNVNLLIQMADGFYKPSISELIFKYKVILVIWFSIL